MSEQNWLKKLKVWAVALVDKPANPEAQVVFWKAGKTKTVSGKTLTASDFAHVGNPNDPETWKLPIHDANHVRNALARFNQTEGLSSADKAKAKAKILAAAKRHGVHATEKVDQTPEPSDNPEAKGGPVGDEDDTQKSGTMPVKCDVCGGEHATGDHEEQVEKQPGLSDVHSPQSAQDEEDERRRGEYGHDMGKSFTERDSMDTQASVQKVADLQTKLAKAEAAATELAGRLEKVEHQQRRERYIQKAALYKHIPGLMPEDFGTILMKIDGALNEPEKVKFDTMLKAADAALRQAAIFAEFGRSGDGDGADPSIQLTKLAKAKQAADPKLSFAKAYELALRENPVLYQEYSKTKKER